LKKFFKEHYKSIIATTLAGLITTIIIWVVKRTFPNVPLFSKFLTYFDKEITVPIYIVLLILLLGICLSFIAKLLFKKTRRSKTREYDTDEVNGLVWEWSNYIWPRHFTPLCPKCLAELPIKDYSRQNKYFCVSCGFEKGYDFNHDVMLKLVKIEIEKRERTEKWKGAEKRIKEIKNKP